MQILNVLARQQLCLYTVNAVRIYGRQECKFIAMGEYTVLENNAIYIFNKIQRLLAIIPGVTDILVSVQLQKGGLGGAVRRKVKL